MNSVSKVGRALELGVSMQGKQAETGVTEGPEVGRGHNSSFLYAWCWGENPRPIVCCTSTATEIHPQP